jgi:exodeoxyribonuclease VII small subunit
MEQKALSFEEAMEKLESIVQLLENGDAPLEKSIELFQEGMLLAQLCNGKLETIEKKIETLIEENGTLVKKPFSSNENKGESEF